MAEAFLRVEGLAKAFGAKAALRNAGFTLQRGRMLGLVGASGSGKSTLARCLAGFEKPDAGTILLDGLPLAPESVSGRMYPAPTAVTSTVGAGHARPAVEAPHCLAGHRPLPRVQLIFQEAAASLNPRFTAEEIVCEPLQIAKRETAAWRRKKAGEWLEAVGIPREAAGKAALAFSGGERQRLAIARALAAEPKLLIVDESLSGLDVVLQAQIGGLVADLRRRFELTCILITHDVGLAARLADEIAVMDGGEIVEQAPAVELIGAPRHARTRELVAASRALALETAIGPAVPGAGPDVSGLYGSGGGAGLSGRGPDLSGPYGHTVIGRDMSAGGGPGEGGA